MSSSFTGNPNNFLQESHIFPEDNPGEHDVKLRQYLNDISSAVNTKDSGLYTDEEVITGQQFLPTFSTTESSSLNYRDVFRTVVDCGALPNATIKTIPHGITIDTNFSLVKIYGASTDPTLSIGGVLAIPLPYVSILVPTDNITLNMNTTDIRIRSTRDYTPFIRTFVVVEYIKVV